MKGGLLARRIAFVQGEYVHIYNRGAGRQPIFFQERNYRYVRRLLKTVTAECEVAVIAYALMPNHCHWVLRQDGETAAGKVPARVFGSYTQAVNRAYHRTGTLFEGPYKALHVDTEAYLLNLCAYLHWNAEHHGLVDKPEDWPFSNYLEWIEKRPGTLVGRELVKTYYSRPEEYEAYVKAYGGRYTYQEAYNQLARSFRQSKVMCYDDIR